jgi:ferric-dicitrate binding protein FerR (iron transport regulator)
VTEGKIDVRDDRKRRTVRLKRGQSYLAAPAAKRRKR